MARSNTIYLRSASGKTESFDQFRTKLRKLSTSEKMRFAELRKLLLKEAQPLVTEARSIAYEDNQANKRARLKVRDGATVEKGTKGSFYNLYSTIGKWANKGDRKAYVVVGLRGPKKDPAGAYYALWQLFGGTSKNFRAKDFIGRATESTDVMESAQKMMKRHIQKRIKAALS